MNAPDAPLPDSRPLLERILHHLDECINPADTHLAVAINREDRYRGMIDRCRRGVIDHAWDKLPMPQFPDWPMVRFPDELSIYVPIVEFGFWDGLHELQAACQRLESIVGKSEYTLDEIVQYRDCEAERIAALEKTLLPFRMLRLRVLEKLGQLESVPAKPAAAIAPMQEQGLSVESRALGVLAEHSDWTNKQIAKAVGTNPKYLSQLPKFKAAREAIRSVGKDALARGAKNRDGKLEAWEEG